MTHDDLEALFARIRTWKPEWQEYALGSLQSVEHMMNCNGGRYLMTPEEQAELRSRIVADDGDYYEPTEEELADIREGLAEEERGEFATEEEIAHVFRRRL